MRTCRRLRACLALLTVTVAAIGCHDAADRALVYRTWRTFGTDDGLPHDSVRALCIAGDDVWVGTDAGLARRVGEKWESWTKADGLAWPVISAIDVDPATGDVWLGTWGGGLVRFTAGRFDQYTQFNSGLAGDLVLAVTVFGGRVWAATNAGISAFDPIGDTWDLYFERRADRPEIIFTGLAHADGVLYAGAWCGPSFRFDARQDCWIPILAAHQSDLPIVITAANSALWRVSLPTFAGRWEAFDSGARLGEYVFLTCAAARNNDEVWLGTVDGLFVLADWDADAWLIYRRSAGAEEGTVALRRAGRVVGAGALTSAPPTDRIRCIGFQGGKVWVGTADGLALGEEPTPWRALPPADAASNVATATLQQAAEDQKSPVAIGLLGTISKPIAIAGTDSPWPTNRVDRVAFGRAIDRANVRGGFRGRAMFQPVTAQSTFARYGWGAPEDTFAILAFEHDVRGIVAYIGPHSLINTALAARSEVPIVNAAPTAPTFDESSNPWIFRCPGNDPRRQRVLLDHVFDTLGHTRPAVLRTSGAETKKHLDWYSETADRRHFPVVLDLECDPNAVDLGSVFAEIRRSRADVVLTWCDAQTSAALLRKMRSAGLDQLFVGSDSIVNDDFPKLVNAEPGSVLAFSRCPHHEVTGKSDLRERAKDTDADLAFEATAHLLAAINAAGRRHDAIRIALERMGKTTLMRLEGSLWRPVQASSP